MSTDPSCVKKKRIQAGHRSWTTRLLSEADSAIVASPSDVEKLAQLKMCLDEKLQTLKQLDAEIIEPVSEEELDAEIGGADGYKENIFSALTQINKALRPPVADPPHTSATAVTMPFTSNKVKLPKLALPRLVGAC